MLRHSLCLMPWLAASLCYISPAAWGHAGHQPARAPLPEAAESAAEPEPESEPTEFPETSPAQPELPNLQLLNPFNAPFQQQNFVPDISLILDASAGGRNLSNAAYQALRQPLSLRQPMDLHHAMNLNNSFNFNYAELTLSAPVDPYFDLLTTFHLTPLEFEIEEAYFNTRGLPWNLQLKAGKFLSHFGRINPQHAHFWQFNDLPVIQQAFFGNHGLNELGARLSWLVPLELYLELGLELLQGQNRSSFGTQGFEVGDQALLEVNTPNLLVATAKTSVDLLDNLVLLGGLSYAQGGTRFAAQDAPADVHVHQLNDELPGLENFAGGNQVWGLDLNLRWFIDSYRELSWQSEYLYRDLQGSQYTGSGAQTLNKQQSGFYSQLLWRFDQQWRTGLRLDLLTQNQTQLAAQAVNGPAGLPRYTAMLEYNPTEFSRFRLQYNLDQTRFAGARQETVHEVFLQVNLAMGAHGAHEF